MITESCWLIIDIGTAAPLNICDMSYTIAPSDNVLIVPGNLYVDGSIILDV